MNFGVYISGIVLMNMIKVSCLSNFVRGLIVCIKTVVYQHAHIIQEL